MWRVLLLLLVLFGFGILGLASGVYFLKTKKARGGTMFGQITITKEDNPRLYWLFVCISFAVGILFITLGIICLASAWNSLLHAYFGMIHYRLSSHLNIFGLIYVISSMHHVSACTFPRASLGLIWYLYPKEISQFLNSIVTNYSVWFFFKISFNRLLLTTF